MTNGSSQSRWESKVHTWEKPTALGLPGEVHHPRRGRVRLQDDAEVHGAPEVELVRAEVPGYDVAQGIWGVSLRKCRELRPQADHTELMDKETIARRAACTRFLSAMGWSGPNGTARPPSPRRALPDTVRRGRSRRRAGGVRRRSCLGKPAGRLSAERDDGPRGDASCARRCAPSRTVLWHPWCHLENHENGAHLRLHQLVGRQVGGRNRLIELADLEEVAEPVAALLLELPQRDLGGPLPEWDELVAQVTWARDRGPRSSRRGATLGGVSWLRPYTCRVSALFDTVYVSFYKGIGALPGCCVAGPADVVAQVREWRHRLGGTLFALWPGAASAHGARYPHALAEMPARLGVCAAPVGRSAAKPSWRAGPSRAVPQTADDAPASQRSRSEAIARRLRRELRDGPKDRHFGRRDGRRGHGEPLLNGYRELRESPRNQTGCSARSCCVARTATGGFRPFGATAPP